MKNILFLLLFISSFCFAQEDSKKLATINWWSDQEAYPEYPGAILQEDVVTYNSSIDASVTTLKVRVYFPQGATNLPMLSCFHGFEETATALGENFLRRLARYGFFVAAFELRGSSGSGGNSGNRDIGGRETMDAYDGEEALKITYAANLAFVGGVCRQGIHSQSAGGQVALNLLRRFPDRYVSCASYFPVVSPEQWHTFLGPSARQTALEAYIGGAPGAVPDAYEARNALNVNNIQAKLFICHDTEDASVDVEESQNLAAALLLAGKDYTYNESTIGSTYRWSHGNPDTFPDLEQLEPLWKNDLKTGTIKSVATSGTLDVPGMVKTRLFTQFINSGNFLDAGRSRVATLTYSTVANTYNVTNASTLDAVFCTSLPSGFVGVAALVTAESTIISPATIVIDGDTPAVWFDAAIGRLDVAGDVKIWCDKTGGPAFQGYALRAPAALPALLPTAINSLPAIQFTAASSEYLQGERRTDLQAKAGLTIISVGTGPYIGHGQTANLHTQQALSGTSIFTVFANGSNSFGSYAGESAAYLVRTALFDGTQTTNTTSLVARKNKVAQTLSFTGTIPDLTENGSTSIMSFGKRVYDATFIGNDLAEVIIFNYTLTDAGDKEDILKLKYNN